MNFLACSMATQPCAWRKGWRIAIYVSFTMAYTALQLVGLSVN